MFLVVLWKNCALENPLQKSQIVIFHEASLFWINPYELYNTIHDIFLRQGLQVLLHRDGSAGLYRLTNLSDGEEEKPRQEPQVAGRSIPILRKPPLHSNLRKKEKHELEVGL
ncbi:hypothetical protein AKJ16_DCAP17569 [Drosera capensis]